MAEDLIPIGNSRIYYVEPNYVSNVGTDIGEHGLHTNESIPDPSDYSIFVNLKVQVKGRNINIHTTNEGKEFAVNYEDMQPGEFLSFLKGTEYEGVECKTRCYLTTKYTDLYVDDVKTGENNEMFGISSIDIEYTHMMVPQVKIKFVDVRGASLFSPEEEAHDATTGLHKLDVEGSFFKSFFSFPYPRYILEVKGFYGEPVSYELSCSEWKAHFDSSTGNFNVDSTFVGFAYAFLSDVMMNAITSAPYSDYLGEDYWNEKVNSGEFYTIDETGGHTPMKRLPEIVQTIKSLTTEQQEQTSTAYVQEQAEREAQESSSNSETQSTGSTNSTDTNTTSNSSAVSETTSNQPLVASLPPAEGSRPDFGWQTTPSVQNQNEPVRFGDTGTTNGANRPAEPPYASADGTIVQKQTNNQNDGKSNTTGNTNTNSNVDGSTEQKLLSDVMSCYEDYMKHIRNVANFLMAKRLWFTDFKIGYDSVSQKYVRGVVCVLPGDIKSNKDIMDRLSMSDKGKTALLWKNLNDSIDNYNSQTGKNIKNTLTSPETISPTTLFSFKGKKMNEMSLAISDDMKEKLKSYPGVTQWLNEYLEKFRKGKLSKFGKGDRWRKDDKDKPHTISTDEISGVIILDNGFYDTLFKTNEDVNQNIENEQQSSITEEQQKMIDALGFVPTIENISRIIMAHFETLIHMIKQTALDIENDTENRSPEKLGVDLNRIPDLRIGKDHIPPFPRVTEVSNKNSEGGYSDEEECWIGNLSGNWREEDLINGIINGVNEASKKLEAAKRGEPISNTDNVGSYTTPMEYPMCPTDFIITGNPYGSDVDFSDFTDVVGRVGIRMAQIFGVSNIDYGSHAKTIGKLEAYNFAKFFPNPSKEFIEKLSVDNVSFTQVFVDLLKGSSDSTRKTYGKKYSDTEYGYAWDNPSSKGSKGLFMAEGNADFKLNDFFVKETVKTRSKAGYAGVKDGTSENKSYYIPVQNVGFKEINSDMPFVGKDNRQRPSSLDNYLATSDTANDEEKDKTVPNVVFIDATPDRYENIINNKFNDEYSSEVQGIFKDFKCTAAMYEDCYINHQGLYKKINKEIPIIVEKEDGTEDKEQTAEVFPIKVDKGKKYGLFKKGFVLGNGEAGSDFDLGNLPYFEKSDVKYEKINFEEFCADYDFNKYTVNVLTDVDYDDTNDGNVSRSVFGSPVYYSLSSDKEKATYFLISLRHLVDYDTCLDRIVDYKTPCSFVPYASILLAGAVLSVDSEIKELKENINDYRKKFINVRNDVRNFFIDEFNKWMNEGFKAIQKLELRFTGEFPKEDFHRWVLNNKDVQDDKIKGGDTVKYFADKLENYEDFFANYVTVDEDYVDGFLLANRESGEGTKEATKVILKRYAVLKTTAYAEKDRKGVISISQSNGNNFIDGFVDELKIQYGVSSNTTDNKGETSGTKLAKDNATMTNDDIRVGIYRYIKLIYDRWIAGDNVGDNFTLKYYFEGDNPVFVFIDTFYHKIGQSILINIGDFADKIIEAQTSRQYSLLSMFGDICNVNKFLFFCINNFIDLSKQENLKNIFKPISYLDMKKPANHPNFIFNYTYEASSHLDLGDGNAYKGDSFMITPEGSHLPIPLQGGNETDYHIPAFGVSYGKQYQSFFSDIDVSMDSPIATDQAIKAQYMIASMNNDNKESENKRMSFVGQDLYTVYSNNSYTCTIKMMGCAWIQPLMYFCLTNVPLFRGTYQIMNVTHSIQPGNMTTTFKGVRMANVQNRKVKNWVTKGLLNQSSGRNDMEARKNALANYDNDCPYKVYPLFGGGKGGSIPQEDLMSRTIDVWNKYGWNVDKWKDASIESAFENQPLWETLCDIVYRETGGEYSGRIGNKIQAAFICNYWHHPNKKYSHGIFKNKKMGWYNEDYLDKPFRAGNYKKYKYWEDIKEVFFNGPASLIGQMTEVSYPVEIVSKYNHTGKKSSPVALTYDMLSKMTNYCTMCGWDPVLAKQKVCKGAAKENPNQAFWWGGEWLFQNKYHIYVNDGSIDHFWQLEPEVRNDKDKEKDKLAKAFAKAVNQTCQSSGIGANIGIDEKNIANNTIRFTCDDKSKLIGVFDVCLNSDYIRYVEELKWVIKDDNGAKENPEHIQVKVVEKTPPSRIIGVYKADGTCFDSKEVHDGYRKCITKYLKSGGNESFIKTKIDSNGIEIKDCNSLIGNSDYGYGTELGKGGSIEGIDENATIGGWKVGLFEKQLILDSNHGYDGRCTHWVMVALDKSGQKYTRVTYPWQLMQSLLSTGEWVAAASGTTPASVVRDFNFSVTPQTGDICVMWPVGWDKRSSVPGSGYHSCGYCGSKYKQWCAGTLQKHVSPYGAVTRTAKSGETFKQYPLTYFLLRHK